MSNEPGLTLGRLVAAEKNALAALDVARSLTQENGALKARVAQLEAERVQDQERFQNLNVQIALMKGTGATQR